MARAIRKANKTKPRQTKPRQTKPRQTKPRQTKPRQTKPRQTKPAKAKVVARAVEKIEASEDSEATAEAAGLVYVSDEDPGITRKRSGTGWSYVDAKGQAIKDYWERKRIDKIAVPPAYTDVWICPKANGHVQATGRDDRGRKQYRYHPKWTEARDTAKYERMVGFAELLPGLRERVAADMRRQGLPREKVAATLVALLEKTLIRIGNEDYAKENKSFGPDHPAQPAPRHRGLEPALRLQGQEWQDLEPGPARSPGRQGRALDPGAARPAAVPVCRRVRQAPADLLVGRERLFA